MDMMLVPRKNNFDLFDNFFDDDFFTKKERNLMKTDILEKKDHYEIAMDLPGFNKENIDMSLKNGYLEIHAKIEQNENQEEEKYLRQERFYGECSRSFYVGDRITEEDIQAEFKEGILKVEIPKKEEIFTLRTEGMSMKNIGIYDGDIVIVKRTASAKNGDYVVALDENGFTTLKTFYKEDGHFRLQPENETLSPIILDKVTILGIAIGLYRQF